jgi:hypothetical protein
MTNERMGFPSASAAKRWVNCVGSHLAQQGIIQPESDDATEGRMLHKAVEQMGADNLTDDQKYLVGYCVGMTDTLCRQHLGMGLAQLDALMLATREVRLWERSGDRKGFAYSGQADLMANDGNGRVLLVDYKFGRLPVDAAEDNMQLAALAVLADSNLPIKVTSVTVAIIQPRADEAHRVTVATCTAEHIHQARQHLVAAAERAMRPAQPRTAGDWCRYCAAMATCPAAVAQVGSVVAIDHQQIVPTGDLLERCELAEMVIDAIRKRAKEVLAQGSEIPGWRLKEGATVSSVADPAKAWSAIGEVIGAQSFVSACSVSLPSLVKAWQETQGVGAKVARQQILVALGEAIETKQRSPSLAKEAAK